MDVAEWIIVAILSTTLLIFLIVGIVLIVKLIGLVKEAKEVVVEGHDIAKNTNGIVSNIKGMTSIGGTVEMFVDKYVNPKLKSKIEKSQQAKAAKEAKTSAETKDSKKSKKSEKK